MNNANCINPMMSVMSQRNFRHKYQDRSKDGTNVCEDYSVYCQNVLSVSEYLVAYVSIKLIRVRITKSLKNNSD